MVRSGEGAEKTALRVVMQGMSRRAFLRCFGVAVLPRISVQAKAILPSRQAIRRRIRWVFTFVNPSGVALEAQHFWCYLPANVPLVQSLVDIESSAPFQLLEDEFGHRVFAIEFDRIQPFSGKVVTATATVEMAPEATANLLEEPGAWLAPERFIESDHPLIRTLAQELKGDSSPENSARAIYEWVRDNVAYAGYIEEQRGALRALQERRGDCTEYADLVVALARSAGIPARSVGGYVSEWDFTPKAQDYHNWAELYISGAWRIVDAQKGNWLPVSGNYITFRIQRDSLPSPVGDAHRYRISDGLQVRW